MSRDPLARMDVDTRWAYHRKLRKLQALYPAAWPTYWCAYMALLGEAWATGRRSLTLADAWVPSLPCSLEEAQAALLAAEIVDAAGRVPAASWRTWYLPVLHRLQDKSEGGKRGAHRQWHDPSIPYESCPRCGNAKGTHSQPNAPRPPRQPSTPSKRAPAREAGSKTRGGGAPERLSDLLTPELRSAMALASEQGR